MTRIKLTKIKVIDKIIYEYVFFTEEQTKQRHKKKYSNVLEYI